MRRQRLPKTQPANVLLNEAERLLMERLGTNGKTYSDIVRHGWPDFMVRSKGRVFGIEVKSPGDRVRPNQAKAFEFLESIGIDVFVWTPGSDPVPWRLSPKTPKCYRGAHHTFANRRGPMSFRTTEPARVYKCGP